MGSCDKPVHVNNTEPLSEMVYPGGAMAILSLSSDQKVLDLVRWIDLQQATIAARDARITALQSLVLEAERTVEARDKRIAELEAGSAQ